MKKIHSEKIKNTKSLFEMQDKNSNIISKTFEYKNPNDESKTFKLIIIDNEEMLNNI